jgi:hypothetical protein
MQLVEPHYAGGTCRHMASPKAPSRRLCYVACTCAISPPQCCCLRCAGHAQQVQSMARRRCSCTWLTTSCSWSWMTLALTKVRGSRSIIEARGAAEQRGGRRRLRPLASPLAPSAQVLVSEQAQLPNMLASA